MTCFEFRGSWFINHINFAPTHVVIFFGKFSNYSAMIFQSLYSQCSDWKIIALFLKSAPFAAFLHNIIFFTKMIMMNFRFFQHPESSIHWELIVFLQNVVNKLSALTLAPSQKWRRLQMTANHTIHHSTIDVLRPAKGLKEGFRFDFWLEIIRRDNFSSICYTSSCFLPQNIWTNKNVDENGILAQRKLNSMIIRAPSFWFCQCCIFHNLGQFSQY